MVEGIFRLKSLDLREKSREIRRKVLDYHLSTKTGHVGSSLSCVEILTVLYYSVMVSQDSFILSKGHAAGTLYVILFDKGLIPLEKLDKLEQHPTLNKEFGIEATTGSLGHGLSIGLGMALANKTNRVYVLLSDGECDEGQVWEATRLASQLEIKNLTAVVDCNGWQAFKRTDPTRLEAKLSAFGWDVIWCDGHNTQELAQSLKREGSKPLAVLAKTVKGKGVDKLEDKLDSHYVLLDVPGKSE